VRDGRDSSGFASQAWGGFSILVMSFAVALWLRISGESSTED